MGGHGGLNILPQKRWNVYNYDNREKVKRDEEAAAKEQQIKLDQSRKRLSHHRLQQLRHARGLVTDVPLNHPAPEPDPEPKPEPEPKSNLDHINLFDGIRILDPVKGEDGERSAFKKMKVVAGKKEEPRVVMPEDEKYRLGYGVAGKGVKLPWYMSRPIDDGKSGKYDNSSDDDDGVHDPKYEAKSSGKKTLEQLREERMMREKKEKERENALIREKRRKDGAGCKDKRPFRR